MFNDTYFTGRTYRGCNIQRARGTGYWSAYVGDQTVMADTLAGLKEIIRHYLKTGC